MNLEQMTQEMHNLATAFKKYENTLEGRDIPEIAKNKELMSIFSSLYQLMQSPIFFEVLLNEGFLSSSKMNGTHWSFASSIMPVLISFMSFINLSYIDSFRMTGPNTKYNSQPLVCLEKNWTNSSADFDVFLSQLIQKNCKNERFLRGFRTDVLGPDYETIVNELVSCDSTKATVVVTLTNMTHAESLFFIKNGNTVEVLVSADAQGKSTYIHPKTWELIKKYNITLIPCSSIQVIHNGDCSVHSEVNANAVLCEAVNRHFSVFDTLQAVKKGEFSLIDQKIQLSKILPDYKGPHQPDSITLTRLLTLLASNLKFGAKGWFGFCKIKGIHPQNCVKTSFNDWDTIEYPHFGRTKIIAEKLMDSSERVEAGEKQKKLDIEFKELNRTEKPQPEEKPKEVEKQRHAIPETFEDQKTVTVTVQSKEEKQKPDVDSNELNRAKKPQKEERLKEVEKQKHVIPETFEDQKTVTVTVQSKEEKQDVLKDTKVPTPLLEIPPFNVSHAEFNQVLLKLKLKIKQFDPKKNPELQEAHDAASLLYTHLITLGNHYFAEPPSKARYDVFKSKCKGHIKNAKEGVLGNHRGWEKILLNIFAMIITVGIGYAIAAGINIAINKGKFTFFQTDSEQKLSQIENYVENRLK